MTEYDRLITCGFSPEKAAEVLAYYPDAEERARYIRLLELIYDDRHEFI